MRPAGAVGADIHGILRHHPALMTVIAGVRSGHLPELPDMGMRPVIVLAEPAVNRGILLLPVFLVGTLLMGTGKRRKTNRHSGQYQCCGKDKRQELFHIRILLHHKYRLAKSTGSACAVMFSA